MSAVAARSLLEERESRFPLDPVLAKRAEPKPGDPGYDEYMAREGRGEGIKAKAKAEAADQPDGLCPARDGAPSVKVC